MGTHSSPTRPTAREIIERIRKELAVPWSERTVDTFKIGDPETPVTGVAVTMFATIDVMKRAARSDLNLIITHEPTFYNHVDDLERFRNDPVVAAKRALAKDRGLVVWRFHDHLHRREPDLILEGFVEKLSWQRYQSKDNPLLFVLPPVKLASLAGELREALPASAVRVVGDPDLLFSRVAVAVGAAPSQIHFSLLRRQEVEVLIAGEAREWEAVEYVRDAASAGLRKALITTGHVASEEPGMERCCLWLTTFLRGVPVRFIPAGDPFHNR